MTGLITELHKYDVLCGRGSGPNERAGNIHFRDLVATRKAEYLAVNPRDHQNKNRIAREIVETVRSQGGRFLKRAAASAAAAQPGADGGEAYELADEPTVMEKAKQALRQNRNVNASGGRRDSGGSGGGGGGGEPSPPSSSASKVASGRTKIKDGALVEEIYSSSGGGNNSSAHRPMQAPYGTAMPHHNMYMAHSQQQAAAMGGTAGGGGQGYGGMSHDEAAMREAAMRHATIMAQQQQHHHGMGGMESGSRAGSQVNTHTHQMVNYSAFAGEGGAMGERDAFSMLMQHRQAQHLGQHQGYQEYLMQQQHHHHHAASGGYGCSNTQYPGEPADSAYVRHQLEHQMRLSSHGGGNRMHSSTPPSAMDYASSYRQGRFPNSGMSRGMDLPDMDAVSIRSDGSSGGGMRHHNTPADSHLMMKAAEIGRAHV